MKKIAVILCAAILAACLAGCGGTDSEQASVTESSIVASQAESSTEESSETVSSAVESSEESKESKPEESSEEESAPTLDKAKVNEAYKSVVDTLVKEHGQAAVIDDRSTARGNISGVSVVRLIDFNNDGIDELLCAYSSTNSSISDTVDIYSFVEDKAEVVLKTSVVVDGNDNYIAYFSKDDKTYLITQGNVPVEFDGKEFITADIKPDNNKTKYLRLIKSSQGDKIVQNTFETMKALGCTVAETAEPVNIKDTEAYKNAAAIYNDYINSVQWSDYEINYGSSTIDHLVIACSQIFDYNGDGNFEMLLLTKHQYEYTNLDIQEDEQKNDTPYEGEGPLFLLTIENGQVKTLINVLKTTDSGGLVFVYDDRDDSFCFVSVEASENFENYIQTTTMNYSFYKIKDEAGMEKLPMNYSKTITKSYITTIPDTEEYVLDGKIISKDNFEKVFNHLHNIDPNKIEQLYNEYSGLSNNDRLKELDAFLSFGIGESTVHRIVI